MIPERSFQNASWKSEVVESSLWRGLAACFGLRRIALKAEIDNGNTRESRVSMLLNEGHLDSWVTVIENGIHYNFDITKVMFCSGNCTERMRYSLFNAKDQVVVDLYCGIGYYTLPLLVHAGAKLVYACELNPHSVAALRKNLDLANISSKRYQILEGDNRITSSSICGVADRVSLGLLPSSKDGWPLAIQVLKPCGGWLHIHENVHEEILKSGEWVSFCVSTLEKLSEEKGKPFEFSVTHIEKVKSYAPRIYHIVLDIFCTAK